MSDLLAVVTRDRDDMSAIEAYVARSSARTAPIRRHLGSPAPEADGSRARRR